MSKTDIICTVMFLATIVMAGMEMITIPTAVFSCGFWVLQSCIRDTNRKIEKASKNPHIKMSKDTTRFV